jgi:hypothetical protein
MGNYFGSAVGYLVALPVSNPSDVKYLMYYEALFCGVHFDCCSNEPSYIQQGLFLVCGIDSLFFSHGPKTPPSLSSEVAMGSFDMFKDFPLLLRNRNFMLLTLAYGLPQGLFSAWSGVLDPILRPLGFSQVHHMLNF